MKVVIQRVSQASVTIADKQVAKINQGLLILLGIEVEDAVEDLEWLCQKIIKLRIFGDQNNLMNLSVKDVDGDIILVSQFTLHALTKRGNRPSYVAAARPEKAIPLYEAFKKRLTELLQKDIQSGEFGADMDVCMVNNGPVTIIIDSQNKE